MGRLERMKPELDEFAKKMGAEMKTLARKENWSHKQAKMHFNKSVSILPETWAFNLIKLLIKNLTSLVTSWL